MGRIFGNTGQRGAFGKGKFIHMLPKVSPGGRFCPVRTVPEINFVEIHLEDLFFRVVPLDLEGEQGFPDPAGQGSFPGEEKVLGQLFGQGTGALQHAAGGDIDNKGADNGVNIDAKMLVKALVLDGNNGVLKGEGNFIQGNDGALFQPKLADELAIYIIDAGSLGGLELIEIGDVGQVLELGVKHPAKNANQRETEGEGDLQKSQKWSFGFFDRQT